MKDATKNRVLRQIREKDIVAFGARILRIPSFKTEETRVARFLAGFFRRRGYEVDLQEVEPGRYQTIATLKGSGGGKSLMLNGHIDIDPLAMGWKRDPWTPSWEGDRLYGAGAFNMKGGITSMVAAAEAIRKSRVELKGDLVVACVVGELQGGVGTVHALERGVRTDMAIVAEPFGSETLMTTHAGVVGMAINTIGYSQHISRREDAVDAIEKMFPVIEAVRNVKFTYTPRDDLPGLPRIICGAIIAGRGRDHDLKGPNFTSDFCTSLWDVRILPGQTSKSVQEDVRRTLEALKAKDSDLHYDIEIPIPAKYRAMRVVMEPVDIPKDEYIVQSVARNFREVTGRPPKTIGALLPRSYAGNDTCHLWGAGIPCVLYGPGGGRGEQGEEPDTYTVVSEMSLCAKVMALTALDVCDQPN
ncbi:MAG: M20 family metallopeptidase [Dehalococcoidia bacterium]